MHGVIEGIAFCIIAAWALGMLAQLFRQPIILAYLVGGFLLGPSCFGLVKDQEAIQVISELGLIFLLFMIGLEIDLKKIISAGSSILVTAASQIVGGAIIGVLFFWLLRFPFGGGKWDALYLGVAAALSSTVIIVKVLYDKRELDTLPGRVTLGVLVLQDLFAILFLAVQPSLNNLQISSLLLSFARVAVLVVTALAISRFLLPHLFRSVARLPELVLVGAIAWCFLVGQLAEWLHLSREMGALIAGVSLSTFPYALDVTAKVTSLRDFFVTLFFVGLGMAIPIPTVALIGWALVYAAFTVGSRFVTTFTPLYFLKSGLRASLLPSINLSQISEFSLVVMALGLKNNHFGDETKGIVTFGFVLLAVASTFGMMQSDALTRAWIPRLKGLGLHDLDDAAPAEGADGHHGAPILILGFFRTASSLIEELSIAKQELLQQIAVVDFNPHVHATLKARGIKVIYGDISQRETLHHAGVSAAEVLVCTIPDSLLKGITNVKLVRQLREMNPKAKIITTADILHDVSELYHAGADYVNVGRLDEAAQLCAALEAARTNLLKAKKDALDVRLADRKEVMP